MLDPRTLDKATQERLVQVLHKEDHELRDDERAFLAAREAYIKDKHKADFPSVFGKDAQKKRSKSKGAKVEEVKEEPKKDLNTHPSDTDEDEEEEDSNLPG